MFYKTQKQHIFLFLSSNIAAHCIQQNSEEKLVERDLAVALGFHNISKWLEIGRILSGVKSIFIHDNWNPSTMDFDGDIAVIKLVESINFDNYIRPVCLIGDQKLSSKYYGIVAGWGYHDDNEKISNLPRKIEIPIVKDRECFRRDNILARIIWEEAFCAGKDGVGVCKGDSGSGFYVEIDGVFYLRGIVSSSVTRPYSQQGLSIFSDVYMYKEFIKKMSICFLKNYQMINIMIKNYSQSSI